MKILTCTLIVGLLTGCVGKVHKYGQLKKLQGQAEAYSNVAEDSGNLEADIQSTLLHTKDVIDELLMQNFEGYENNGR